MTFMPIVYRCVPDPGPDLAWTLGQSLLGALAALAMARAFLVPRQPERAALDPNAEK